MNPLTIDILETFSMFRMSPLPEDQFELVGKQKMADKIQPFIKNNEPIRFVMLGYPMKSPNDRDKVIGRLPDMGEEISFKNFSKFNATVQDIYKPGINVTIVSDGYMFNDILKIEDRIVDEYGEVSKDISKDNPITWYNAKDFYKRNLSIVVVRDRIMQQFGITDEELQRRILFDMDTSMLYRGMIRFMEGDLAINNYNSKNQLHIQAKITAKEMMLRNEAYSKLVQTEFRDHIRLSIHPSLNNGNKYSFQLIPGARVYTTPWHSALLIDKNGYATIHKKDAIAQGLELVNEHGRPYYFTTPN